ncbi:MAG: ankyrin repeat domain-containing protein [Armatimonadota bacterium]
MEQNNSNAEEIFKEAVNHLHSQKPDDVIDLLTKKADVLSGYPLIYEYLGIAYWMKGDLNQAESNLLAAYSAFPESTATAYNLALVYKSKEQISEAIKYLQIALNVDPTYKPAMVMLHNLQPEATSSDVLQEQDQSVYEDNSDSYVNGANISVTPATLQFIGPASRILPMSLTISDANGSYIPWGVASCPWWLDAYQEVNRLNLRVSHCGHLTGAVTISSNGLTKIIPVLSMVTPDKPYRWSGMLRGIASITGSAIIFWMMNTVPLLILKEIYSSSMSISPMISTFSLIICAFLWGVIMGGKRLAYASTLAVIPAMFLTLISIFIYQHAIYLSLLLYIIGFILWAWLLGGWWLAIRSTGWGVILGILFGIPAVYIGYGMIMSHNSHQSFWMILVITLVIMPMLIYAAIFGRLLTPLKHSDMAGRQISNIKLILHDFMIKLRLNRYIKVSEIQRLGIYSNVHSPVNKFKPGRYVLGIMAVALMIYLGIRITRSIHPGENQALVNGTRNGDISTVTNLLNHGANPNSIDSHGTPILILAINNGKYNLAHQLLVRGANPNSTDKRGFTALLYCAQTPAACQMAQMLLTHGANLYARDRNGQTAQTIAVKNGNFLFQNMTTNYMRTLSNKSSVTNRIPPTTQHKQSSSG